MPSILFALALLLSVSAPPVSSAPRDVRAKASLEKVWLNEDVEALRELPTLSITGVEAAEAAPESEVEVAAGAVPRLPKEKDPEWYLWQMKPLREGHEDLQNDARRYRAFRASYATGDAGINLNIENLGITPESSIELLETRARRLRHELDALEDKAQRNSIRPGDIR